MKKKIIFKIAKNIKLCKRNNSKIIYYHSIGDNYNDGLSVNKKTFEKHIKWLLNNNYKIYTIDEFIKECWYNNKENKKCVAITFDDGYEDNYYNAFEILKKYNIKATIYIITALIDKGNIKDNYKLYPNRSILNKKQIKEIYDYGIEIGSHSHSHLHFANALRKDSIKAIKDIEMSKIKLEEIINGKITSFAYPNGQRGTFNIHTQKVLEKLGFENAVTTMVCNNIFTKKNIYEIPRIEIKSTDTMDIFIDKIKGKYDFLSYYYNMRDLSKKW